jgi:hypothetical protein
MSVAAPAIGRQGPVEGASLWGDRATAPYEDIPDSGIYTFVSLGDLLLAPVLTTMSPSGRVRMFHHRPLRHPPVTESFALPPNTGKRYVKTSILTQSATHTH